MGGLPPTGTYFIISADRNIVVGGSRRIPGPDNEAVTIIADGYSKIWGLTRVNDSQYRLNLEAVPVRMFAKAGQYPGGDPFVGSQAPSDLWTIQARGNDTFTIKAPQDDPDHLPHYWVVGNTVGLSPLYDGPDAPRPENLWRFIPIPGLLQ